jgi:hypothetical protein
MSLAFIFCILLFCFLLSFDFLTWSHDMAEDPDKQALEYSMISYVIVFTGCFVYFFWFITYN